MEERVSGSVCGLAHIDCAKGTASLEHLVISKAWQGCGLGHLLLKAVETWARDHSPHFVLEVGCMARNSAARAFYRREGFRTDKIPQYGWTPEFSYSHDQKALKIVKMNKAHPADPPQVEGWGRAVRMQPGLSTGSSRFGGR